MTVAILLNILPRHTGIQPVDISHIGWECLLCRMKYAYIKMTYSLSVRIGRNASLMIRQGFMCGLIQFQIWRDVIQAIVATETNYGSYCTLPRIALKAFSRNT